MQSVGEEMRKKPRIKRLSSKRLLLKLPGKGIRRIIDQRIEGLLKRAKAYLLRLRPGPLG